MTQYERIAKSSKYHYQVRRARTPARPHARTREHARTRIASIRIMPTDCVGDEVTN